MGRRALDGSNEVLGRVARSTLLLALSVAGAPTASADLIVERIRASGSAAQAGLEIGDRLISWTRPATETVPDSASGTLESPFDLRRVEIEQGGIATVTLDVVRDDEKLQVEVPGGPWIVESRPLLAGDDLVDYRRGCSELEAGDLEAARATLTALASRWEAEGAELDAAWLLSDLAAALAEGGSAEAADELHGEALEAAGPGAEPRVRALLLELWGNHHLDRNEDLGRAEELHREALEIRATIDPGGLDVARSLDNLGFVALQRGDTGRAVELLERRLDVLRGRAPRSAEMANAFHNLGYLAWSRDDLIEADRLIDEAWSLKLALDLPPESLTATLSMKGTLAVERRDLEAAERSLRRVLEMRETLGSDPGALAAAMANLAALLQQRGKWAEAERLHRDALAIRERVQPGTIAHASTLWALGALLHDRGDATGARDLFEQALAIQQSVAPGTSPVAVTLVSLGVHSASLGDLELARTQLRRGLDMLRGIAPDGKDRARAAFALHRVERRLGERNAAVDSCREAVATLDRSRDKLGGSFEQQVLFGETVADDYHDCIDLLVELDRPDEAFSIHERAKARVLRGLLVDRGLDDWPGVDPEVAARIESAREEYEAGLDELRSLRADASADQRERLAERLGTLQRRLSEETARARNAHRAQLSLQAPRPLDAAQLQERLRPGTLALSYALGSEGSFLFALGPRGAGLTIHRLDASAAELDRRIASLRSALARPSTLNRRRLEQTANQLGRLLLAPVAERLARAERLLVAPEGSLFFLPFSLLASPNGEDRALVESHSIQLAPSLTLALELAAESAETSGTELIAFADPAVPGDASASDRLRGLFDLTEAPGRLPETREEAAEIVRLRPDSSRLYVGRDATEERAKTATARARYLHFATHAIADSRAPMESALMLSMPEERRPGEENGLLQAWEVIESMKLDAELVTLSACETGLGREAGAEGVLGLPTAFLYAGARNVLASLWRVSDRSTAQLMERFYSALFRGAEPADALRSAQLALARGAPEDGRTSFDHPFHWASFQLIGAGR